VTSPPRFTHNAFPTPRLDECVAFYEEFAEMRVVKRRGDSGERVLWVAPATTDLPIFVLIERPHADPVPRDAAGLRHLGFEVDSREDLDALHARFVAAGRQPTDPEYVNEVVGHIFMVEDPDGRVVEFSAGQDVSPANWDPSARGDGKTGTA
jgi:catechol 2,3-dioxygenase-like lactoylglutathione lyase family enzyme